MTGTGKWIRSDVPHKDWRCIDIEDLGEPAATCEMCEVQEIRYVHSMEHADYPDVLRCGCICAGYMEEDFEGAHTREHRFKANRDRRARWLQRRWLGSGRTSTPELQYLNTGGFHISVFPRWDGQGWGALVRHRESGRQRRSQLPYDTADAAKLAAFDAMLGMAAHIDGRELLHAGESPAAAARAIAIADHHPQRKENSDA
jgi:hypothetical protein